MNPFQAAGDVQLAPFGWVFNSPEGFEPVEGFTRSAEFAEKYRESGWTVTAVHTLGLVAVDPDKVCPDNERTAAQAPIGSTVIGDIHALRRAYSNSSAGRIDSGAPSHAHSLALTTLFESLPIEDQDDAMDAVEAYADMRAVSALRTVIELLPPA